ncbi:cupin domain-containing protein, partial [Sphaerimonospora thailandensis]|uniref:cupin domain-containing protein n=1 Tax=Sphaerimonospora thailandensis TaxID=795644 RepID=UPI001950A8AC
MTALTLPLTEHGRLHTHDADEASAEVGKALAPHRLRLAKGARLDARLNGMMFEQTGLFSLGYGAEVSIALDAMESAFFVEIPLTGVAEVSHGQEQIVSTTGLASVLSPTERMTMHWAAGNSQLIARFDRPALETRLSQMLGRQLRRPLVFSLGMDFTQPACRSWLSLIELLRVEAENPGGMLSQPLAVKQLEGLLMTQLLLAQPNTYTPALLGEQPRVAPPA